MYDNAAVDLLVDRRSILMCNQNSTIIMFGLWAKSYKIEFALTAISSCFFYILILGTKICSSNFSLSFYPTNFKL